LATKLSERRLNQPRSAQQETQFDAFRQDEHSEPLEFDTVWNPSFPGANQKIHTFVNRHEPISSGKKNPSRPPHLSPDPQHALGEKQSNGLKIRTMSVTQTGSKSVRE